MTGLRGGLRTRMMADSFRIMVVAALEDLHWFETGRRNQPLIFAPQPDEWQQEVAPNTFSINPEEWHAEEGGLGNQAHDRVRMYVDLYSENEAVGIHVAHDLRDVLLGLRPDLGRAEPVLSVFDLRLDPPTLMTTVDIVDVRVERTRRDVQAWQRHWFVISCFVEDDYMDELDHPVVGSEWTASLVSALALIRRG